MLLKSLQQNTAPFHAKSLGEIRNSWHIIKMIKAIYSKATINIKLNGEKLEAIPPKSGAKQGCILSPYLFNIALIVLGRAIRQ